MSGVAVVESVDEAPRKLSIEKRRESSIDDAGIWLFDDARPPKPSTLLGSENTMFSEYVRSSGL